MASEMPKGHQNIFKYFQQGSEVVEESFKIFGSRWDIFRNPGHGKMKISDIWLRESWQDYRTPAFQVEGLGFELQLDHQAGSIKPNKMMLAAI